MSVKIRCFLWQECFNGKITMNTSVADDERIISFNSTGNSS